MNEGPNRTLWLLIVGLAVLLVAGGWAANTFLGVNLPGHDTTPVAITVAVAPQAYEAVNAAAAAYAAGNPRMEGRPIVVKVVQLDGQQALKIMDSARYSPTTVWICEAQWLLANAPAPLPGFVRDGAGAPQSIARTYMVWGAFKKRADAITQQYGGLSWTSVHDASVNGDALNLALAHPAVSAQGLAALAALTADVNGRPDVTPDDFNALDRQGWLRDTFNAIPNWKRLGGDPVKFFAEVGQSQADMGFVAESDWLRQADAIQKRGGASLIAYPPITTLMDFPYALWAGATPEEQSAALDFRAYLRGAWQARLGDYGLRPVQGPANGGVFATQAVTGVNADPAVTPVNVTAALLRALRAWATSNSIAP